MPDVTPASSVSTSSATEAPTSPSIQTRPMKASAPAKPLPRYNVVLLNDDHHTYEYVIMMLRRLFGHPENRGYQLAECVDRQGRAILMTTHHELAELKRDQIHAFGGDPRISASRGSMTAIIEPVDN